MRLQLILIAVLTIVVCGSCNDSEVDTTYSLKADNVKVKLANADMSEEEAKERMLDYLEERQYLGDLEISGESRSENDKEAKIRFEGKIDGLKEIDLDLVFSLKDGQTASVTLDYSLSRKNEVLVEPQNVQIQKK